MFPGIFSHSLATLISFDECTQILYDGDRQPALIGFDGEARPRTASERRDSGAVQHPFRRMYRAGTRSGVFLSHDIVRSGRPSGTGRQKVPQDPENGFDYPANGYLADGGADGNEELCIALPLPGEACTLVILTRRRSGRNFTDEEAERARSVLPFLTSVFRRHWRSAGRPAAGAP